MILDFEVTISFFAIFHMKILKLNVMGLKGRGLVWPRGALCSSPTTSNSSRISFQPNSGFLKFYCKAFPQNTHERFLLYIIEWGVIFSWIDRITQTLWVDHRLWWFWWPDHRLRWLWRRWVKCCRRLPIIWGFIFTLSFLTNPKRKI